MTTATKEQVHTAPIQDVPNEGHTLTFPDRPSAQQQIADAWNQAAFEAFCNTYMPKATVAEVALFEEVCRRTGLSPYARQLYPIKRRVNEGGQWIERWSFQVSIDGFRLIAERTGAYRGQTTPLFCGPDAVWTELWLDTTPPVAAKVGVLRSDFDQPLYAIAKWSEYAQRTRDGSLTSMWQKMPALMLAKVGEALALRKAFPQELSGLYTTEEMAQADTGRVDSRRAGQTQTGDHAAGSVQAAESAADPFDTLAVDTLTLEQAKALPLLGRPDKWNGNGGKPLGDVPEKMLRRVSGWLADKLEEDARLAIDADNKLNEEAEHRFRVTRAAIALVLGEIERTQGQLPLAGAPSTAAGSTSASATTSAAPTPTTPGASDGSFPLRTSHTATSRSATTTEAAERARLADDDKSMIEWHHELRDQMDHPLMPKEARAYFSSRVTNGKVATPTAAKIHIALAKLCVELGNELVTATERQKKEIVGMLLQTATYKPDTLTALRDGLAASVPGQPGTL